MRLSTFCMSTNQRQGQPHWISIRLNSNNTELRFHQEHLWQVWSRSLQPFLFLMRSWPRVTTFKPIRNSIWPPWPPTHFELLLKNGWRDLLWSSYYSAIKRHLQNLRSMACVGSHPASIQMYVGKDHHPSFHPFDRSLLSSTNHVLKGLSNTLSLFIYLLFWRKRINATKQRYVINVYWNISQMKMAVKICVGRDEKDLFVCIHTEWYCNR